MDIIVDLFNKMYISDTNRKSLSVALESDCYIHSAVKHVCVSNVS